MILDSNRRVGVWSLPWRWHILSIPLTTGRGTGAETCELDDVFPPDDICSRPEDLHSLYEFCYRTFLRFYTYNRSVIQYWWSCTPSYSIGLYFWWMRGSWVACHFLFSLVYQLCLALINSLILGWSWLLVFVLNNTLIVGIWCSAISHLPGCFCP